MILNNIGTVYYNQGDYQFSIEYLQKSIDLALEIKGGQILWEAYLELANSQKKQQHYQDALNNYKNSISIIEDIRSKIKLEELKASYLGTNKRLEAYHNLIDLLINLHDSDPERSYDLEAFTFMEKVKARSFLDSLEVSAVDISSGTDLKLLDQEKEIMKEISEIYQKLLAPKLTEAQIATLEEELKTYEDKLESVRREIRISSPAYANLKYPEIISFREVQKRSPKELY
jgi:tetratricopeptide (TPR) repeat protein